MYKSFPSKQGPAKCVILAASQNATKSGKATKVYMPVVADVTAYFHFIPFHSISFHLIPFHFIRGPGASLYTRKRLSLSRSLSLSLHFVSCTRSADLISSE